MMLERGRKGGREGENKKAERTYGRFPRLESPSVPYILAAAAVVVCVCGYVCGCVY